MPTLRVTEIPPELATKLVRLAIESDTTVADIAREAIERGVARADEDAAFKRRLEAGQHGHRRPPS